MELTENQVKMGSPVRQYRSSYILVSSNYITAGQQLLCLIDSESVNTEPPTFYGIDLL